MQLEAGPIERIIDTRGFMPLEGSSIKHNNAKYPGWENGKPIINYSKTFDDDCKYFKYPTAKGLVLCLFQISLDSAQQDFESKLHKLGEIPTLRESQITDGDVPWLKLGHNLNQVGPQIFDSIPSKPLTARFNESDLVATVFFKESVVFIINIRFSTWARNGSGQVLLGFEFSRRVGELKKCHSIRLTEISSGNSAVIHDAILPAATEALKVFLKPGGK